MVFTLPKGENAPTGCRASVVEGHASRAELREAAFQRSRFQEVAGTSSIERSPDVAGGGSTGCNWRDHFATLERELAEGADRKLASW